MTSAEATSKRIVRSVGTTRIGISVLVPTVLTGSPSGPVGVRVDELPVPLERVDRDRLVRVVAALLDLVLDDDREEEQAGDDQERQDRVDDLQRQVVRRLLGQLVASASGGGRPDQRIRPQTPKPTISAAMTEPVHSSRMSCDCSVMPSGQPNRQNSLFGISHPVRVTTPRRPSAASRASLLPRATARCLLVLRPGAPDGPPSGSSTGSGGRHPRRSQCGARLADSARRLTTGDTAPAGRTQTGPRGHRHEPGARPGAGGRRLESGACSPGC